MECDVKLHTGYDVKLHTAMTPTHMQCNNGKIINETDASPGQGHELYDEIRILGKGGSAFVYLVKSKQSGKLYAMKKIALDESRQMRKKENVLKEALLLSRLKHPHIVTCRTFFFDEFDDNLSIIQDYCDDATIFDKISEMKINAGKIEESLVLRWFVQILMAVQYIHAQKILHRDIKSQNVFLTRAGIAKLGDFGIARVMENTVDLAQTCIGTPCYLSPEVCQDLPYSSKADIWALGCLLYEMCMLQYPFDAGNIVTLYYKIVKCDYKEVSSLYSSEIHNLISDMLNKSSEDRPTISAIMNNPFIQGHLQVFLTDCELKQEQSCKNKVVSDQKKSKLFDATPAKEQADENLELKKGTSPIVMSSKDTGIYADDFIEEDESDYSDDFEDEDEDDIDDNEFDSDEQDKFTTIVANARDEVEKKRVEKSDEDFAESVENEDGNICRNFFKRHCKDVMGSTMYHQIVNICRKGKDKDFSLLKSDFKDVAGEELLDTCFLVNELVMNEKNN